MSELNEYTPELFELIDEDGNKKRFELLDVIESGDELYYAMVPEYNDDEILSADFEVVLLKVIEEDGEELLSTITDDEEYLRINEIFLKRMEEMLDEDE